VVLLARGIPSLDAYADEAGCNHVDLVVNRRRVQRCCRYDARVPYQRENRGSSCDRSDVGEVIFPLPPLLLSFSFDPLFLSISPPEIHYLLFCGNRRSFTRSSSGFKSVETRGLASTNTKPTIKDRVPSSYATSHSPLNLVNQKNRHHGRYQWLN
jgi:hypothetical protein